MSQRIHNRIARNIYIIADMDRVAATVQVDPRVDGRIHPDPKPPWEIQLHPALDPSARAHLSANHAKHGNPKPITRKA
jgi:hypothetical protein